MIRQSQTVQRLLRAAPLLLVCLVPVRPSSAAQGNAVNASAMVQEHNALRTSVGAPKLRWSDSLARQAAAWANKLKEDGCSMKHSHAAKIGENLYWASALKKGSRGKGKSTWQWSVTPQPITEKDVVAAWATEQPWYSRATDTCEAPLGKTCGHYTQIVWKTTREVGCAKALCGDSSQVWVCNYAPAGNVVGQRPY